MNLTEVQKTVESLRTRPGPMLVLCLALCMHAAEVKRGRSEGTMNINPSNVIGTGNITAYAAMDGTYGRLRGIGIDPVAGVQVGVGGILQFQAQSAFAQFQSFGPMEAHLQATTPMNDRLRFLGIGVSGDLYLSTTKDTLSTGGSKPDYNPFFGVHLTGDVDWLARFKGLPLKTYLEISMADNPQLLNQYNQLAGKVGIEWKMNQHSIFADVGAGLYKEKSRRDPRDPFGRPTPPDKGFEQYYAWLEPGGRYRLFKRFSIMAGLRVILFQHVKSVDPLKPVLLGLTVRAEAPVFFRETNTEAIRTLVFMERVKAKGVSAAQAVDSSASGIARDLGFTIDGLESDAVNAGRTPDDEEAEQKKRREEIQQKMDEIEKLLQQAE